MCAYGGIQDEGGPRSSHHFAFSKILSTIYVYGDGNTTCVHTRNLIKKVFHKCYTGLLDKKNFRQPKGLTTIIFNKSIILLVFHLIPKGVLWGVYE